MKFPKCTLKRRTKALEKLNKQEDRDKKRLRRRDAKGSRRLKSSENGEVIPLHIHNKMIEELQATKKQVEDEKKRAMQWCLTQMVDIQQKHSAQEYIIQQQQKDLNKFHDILTQKVLHDKQIYNLLSYGKGVIAASAQALEDSDSEKQRVNQLLELKNFALQLDLELGTAIPTSGLFETKCKKSFDDWDVMLVMKEAHVTRETAKMALVIHSDVVKAILACTEPM